ncbi:hypothetical protein BJ742DRAFT_352537 [Cladochytrium replicatum]|nr:hypothetical protein BJ742DRAFT_352537 [Cladochytrium replicatum]
MSTSVRGWMILGVNASLSAFGSLYSAYRASRSPKAFNWVLFSAFALMFVSDMLAFIPSFLPRDPLIFTILLNMVTSLNIISTAIKTVCNLIRFEGVFHSIITATTRFPYRTWMNRVLVALTCIIPLISVAILWIIDIYPYYNNGKQLGGLPPQFNGGRVGSVPATIWIVTLDWLIGLLSLAVVRMLRKKWGVIKQRQNVRSTWTATADAGHSNMQYSWPVFGKYSEGGNASFTRNSNFRDSGVPNVLFSTTSAASLKAYPELQSYKHPSMTYKISMSSMDSSVDNFQAGPPPPRVYANPTSMYQQHPYQQRSQNNVQQARSEYDSQIGSIQPSLYPPSSTAGVWAPSPSSYPPPRRDVFADEPSSSKSSGQGAPDGSTSKRGLFGRKSNQSRQRRRGSTTNDERSERGVRIMYWILSLQVLLPICVMPFYFGIRDLFVSAVTSMFIRIYNLIILEYIYTIRSVVHYASRQAMIEGVSATSNTDGTWTKSSSSIPRDAGNVVVAEYYGEPAHHPNNNNVDANLSNPNSGEAGDMYGASLLSLYGKR